MVTPIPDREKEVIATRCLRCDTIRHNSNVTPSNRPEPGYSRQQRPGYSFRITLQIQNSLIWILALVLGQYSLCSGAKADDDAFLHLFSRHSNQRLSAITQKFVSNTTVELCTKACIRETGFQCKSFDYDNSQRACLLFSVNLDDTDIHLIQSSGKDHYETSYTKLFNRLPSHRLPVDHGRMTLGVSRENCARRCVLENYFKCRGFNFRGTDQTCMLLEYRPTTSTGATYAPDQDYYERQPDEPLSNFINFGMGRMHPLQTAPVHQRATRGVELDECAENCLAEQTFDCLSFDYVFDGADSICYLSKYIAANVGGLVIDLQAQHNHYEKIGQSLNFFYSTPYAVIMGNNLKTFDRVTPDRCARYCLQEESFVCRSFDYRVEGAVCMLSDKTGSDVGGLSTNGGFEGDVHHFEMKPILDCGGNLTDKEGDLATPNWPRDYSHHQQCVWNITTSPHKVLHLRFSHLELGYQSSDPCSQQDDRLVLKERGRAPYCILPNTKTIDTKSNHVTLTFISNGQVDAQGFRLFYTAEWSCNEIMNTTGEIASPHWPDSYPPNEQCSWRIVAPLGYRVHLTFTSFDLEQHPLGHCTEQLDHVRVQDGGTVSAPLVGLYCGSLSAFVVRSSGRDMFVRFVSDNDPDNSRQGFHARVVFEDHNGTVYGGAGLAGPGYKQLDEDDITSLDEEGDKEKLAGGDSDGDGMISLEDHHQYKKTMWAMVTVLLLLLVCAGVGLFLLYRHYRGKLRQDQEIVHQDGVTIPLRDRNSTNLCTVKPSSSPCGQENEYEVPDDYFAPETCGAVGGAASPPSHYDKPNNLQTFGKYPKENNKNINVDSKYYHEYEVASM